MTDYELYNQSIIDSLDFEETAEFYGIEFNRAHKAKCPFHNEDTASFGTQSKKYGHCFGCGWNGNIISFTRKMFNLSWQEAITKLNDDFHLGLPIKRKHTIREQLNMERRIRELRKEREEAEKAHKAYESLYTELWSKWAKYDRSIRELAPKTPESEINPLYAEALKNIAFISYRIDTEL